MSRVLDYPAKCERCGHVMPPGTLAEFVKDGGEYRCWHVDDGCDEAAAASKPIRFKPSYELRECSRDECGYAAGVGFRGQAPPRCPLCNSPWLIEELAA